MGRQHRTRRQNYRTVRRSPRAKVRETVVGALASLGPGRLRSSRRARSSENTTTRSCPAAGLRAGGLAIARARADGAFPDAQNLLTPAAWPNEFILATTFGVVFSQDAGRTWLWTCEQEGNAFGVMYQLSLPPRHRIYALSNNRVVFSDDKTCSWRIAGGAVSGQEIADVWVDRAVPDRLFAIGARCCDAGGSVHSVFPSLDGGQTFGAPIYVGAVGDRITGVETSVSDPRVVYLTIEVDGTRPRWRVRLTMGRPGSIVTCRPCWESVGCDWWTSTPRIPTACSSCGETSVSASNWS